MNTLQERIQQLSSDRLAGIRRGIEKEGLRVLPTGGLALTPHPVALGSALTHPHITTDYSESQLELITGVHADVDGCLDELTQIHQFVYRHIGHATDAEDLAQQAFVEAAKAYETFRGASEFSTWLYGIAMNLVRNHLSRAPHRVHRFEDDEVLAELDVLASETLVEVRAARPSDPALGVLAELVADRRWKAHHAVRDTLPRNTCHAKNDVSCTHSQPSRARTAIPRP